MVIWRRLSGEALGCRIAVAWPLWWTHEIQAAIRSLRLRFTEISKASATQKLGIWHWALGTGYWLLLTGHTHGQQILSAHCRLPVVVVVCILQLPTTKVPRSIRRRGQFTWPTGPLALPPRAERYCWNGVLCLMNNAFAQGAEESGRRIELPIWCRLSDQLS